MKRIVSKLILALMTSCTQPNVTVTMSAKPDKVQSNNQLPSNKPIIDEKKVNTQITNESKTSVEKDANLGVKIDGTGGGTATQPIVIVSVSPSAYQGYDSSTSTQLVDPNVKSTPYPSPFATTHPTDTSNAIDFRDKPFGYYSDPNYGRKYPYSKVDPVSKNLREGSINIIFKDEYKIRLKNYLDNFSKYQQKTTELKSGEYQELYKSIPLLDEFSSLDPSVIEAKKKELSQINEILKKYNVLEIRLSTLIANGEANELQTEKEVQKIYDEGDHGYDVHNIYSHYTISVKDTDIYSLINELRNVEIVRESNYQLKGTNE